MKTLQDVQDYCAMFFSRIGAWPASVKVTENELASILKDADRSMRRMMPYHDDEFLDHTYRNLVVYCPGGPVTLEIMEI